MNEETPPQTQLDETDEPKARRRVAPWFFGGLVLVLLAALIALQVSGVWEFVTPDNAADTLVLYALSTLNFVAFVVFSFILVRSLLKLRSERLAHVLGSRIKTRLVVYFIAVSLLPIAGMAVFSYLFFNRTLEKWFSSLPEGVVQQAREVKANEARHQARSFREITVVTHSALSSMEAGTDPRTKLDELADKGDLSLLMLRGGEEFQPVSSVRGLEQGQVEAILSGAVTATHNDELQGEVSVGGKVFDVMRLPVGEHNELIAARERRSDPRLAELVQSSQTFDNFKRRQRKVRLLGLSTLGLLTMLLVFAATWAAIHLARGIGTPIRALAEAADEVARGNLAYRVNVTGDDELAVLADTFNQMTAQLEANRGHIEANAAQLSETNLALDERRGYIETVLESLSTGVVSLDAENRLTTINAAAIQMLRLGDAPARGTPLAEIVNTEDRAVLDRVLARARRTGRAAWQMELRRGTTSESAIAPDGVAASEHSTAAADDGAAADGGVVPVALTATAFGATNDGARGVVLVIEDLSELLAAQRAAAWSEVARRMAHEIKNPLTPIQLSAERIARHFPGVAPANGGGVLDLEERGAREVDERVARIVDECTRTITREVAGLKAMVDEFSRFARLPRARLEAGDLNEVVRQAVALYEDRLDEVRLDVLLAPTLPAAMLDAEQLRRVFVNLLDNALEATAHAAGERRITVATAHDPARGLLLAEVADTGHGIAREDFPRLFQPYFSTRGRGTGLGLAIVQHIINDHGGRIRAEPNRPRGAKFLVEIPVGEEQRSEVRGQRSEEEQGQEKLTTNN